MSQRHDACSELPHHPTGKDTHSAAIPHPLPLPQQMVINHDGVYPHPANSRSWFVFIESIIVHLIDQYYLAIIL